MRNTLTKNGFSVESLDRAIEIMREPRKPWGPNNPYLLPNRAHWQSFPAYMQAIFERDLQLGIGVLPEKLIELKEM